MSARNNPPPQTDSGMRGDEGESQFNTDYTRTIFEAVRQGVPSWCIVVTTDHGVKGLHNVRQEIEDRMEVLGVKPLWDGDPKTRKKRTNDKVNAIRAMDAARDVYASYHTLYADIEEGTTADRRRIDIKSRRGRNPLNFFWLVIDCILNYDLLTFEYARGLITDQLEVISRAVADYDMSQFDDPFASDNEITYDRYAYWRKTYFSAMERDAAEARELKERIEFMEGQYNSESMPDMGDYFQYNSRFRLKPVLVNNGVEYEVKPSDGLHIYEMSRTTRYVPVIHYMDERGVDYYRAKQYPLMDVNTQTTQRDIAYPKHAKVPKPNYIVFTLWLGDPYEEGLSIAHSPINTLTSVAYKLNHGTMTIRMDLSQGKRVTSIEVVRDRIAEAFPNLIFRDFIPVGYRGSFNLYGVSLSESLLMDQLMNDVFFNQYFYLEDRIMPFYRTGTFVLRHISGEVSRQRLAEEVGVKIDVTPLTLASSSRVRVSVVKNGRDHEVVKTYPEGTVYLRVEINKGIKLATYNHIVLVIRTLMAYHNNSGLADNEYPWAVDDVPYPTRRGNIEFTHANYPDLLPSDYATLCSHRPVLADRGKRYTYEVKINNKVTEERTYPVRAYPTRRLRERYPHLPLVYIRSNDPDRPYVNVYKLSDTSIPDYQRYYPCCDSFKSDVIIVPESASPNDPNIIIDYNQVGRVHAGIRDVVRVASNSPNQLVKIGVPRGINSFLYCVLTALKLQRDGRYYKEQELIQLAIDDRSRMSNINEYTWTDDDTPLYLAVAAQQLFDMTEAEVIEILRSDVYLDPRIFVRLVEEYYNVNIIRFHSRRHDVEPALVLPRYREFFSYHHRDRPTIIILTHHGTRLSMSKRYPHCELIAVQPRPQDRIPEPIFPSRVGEILTRIASENDVGLTWVSDGDAIHRYSNAHMRFDWTQFNIYPTGQIIDNLGKVFALRFQHTLGSGVMLIPPYEPFNVPVITSMHPLMSYKTAIQIFGPPDSWDLHEGKVFGLWYHLDVKQDRITARSQPPPVQDYSFKFYVCTKEDSVVDIVSEDRIDEIMTELDIDSESREDPRMRMLIQLRELLHREYSDQDNPSSRVITEPVLGESNLIRYGIQDLDENIMRDYLRTRKINYLIRTLMKWLFRIEFINRNGNLEPQQFMEEFTLLINGEEVYDISKFTSQLPEFNNTDDALDWIATMDSRMVTRNTDNYNVFAIYTQDYYRVLLEELRVFRRVLDNFDITQFKFQRENISNFYTPWEEELETGGEITITSKTSFEQWLDFQEYITGNRVYTIISTRLRQSTAPFIYALESGDAIPNYFLVQNVFRERPGQALAVAAYIANHWVNSSPRVNLSPNGIEDREDFNPSEILDHGVATMSSNGSIVLVNASPQSHALILRYPDNKYAALLQLGNKES